MRVLLAVNYDYHDYGGMLQALATQIVLDKIGIESEVINFDNLKSDIIRRKWKYFLSNITDLSIVKEKGRVLQKKLKRKFCSDFSKKMIERDLAFDDFCSSHFKISKRFLSWEDLSDSCKHYNAVIVGSDQLWLPSNVMADYYTLSFVPKGVKKIAYATSFGIGKLPADMVSHYAKFLNRIEHLSARETTGQQIIKQCIEKDVPLVCDPTLLIEKEDWDKIVSPRLIKEEYIFCYFMGDNPEQREFVKRLANVKGCKVVALLHLDQYIANDEIYVDEAPYAITPADFVSLVKHAAYICTDSFHGTVFSIIFSKNFFTFRRFNSQATLSTNSRIDTLLSRMNLTSRLYIGTEDVNQDLSIQNYSQIQYIVSDFRRTSLQYLKTSIGIRLS